MSPRTKINIIGTGISGLLTAYFLQKFSNDNSQIDIHLYDAKDREEQNATTISLAWLNALNPCNGSEEIICHYDQFRLQSIQTWQMLIEDFKLNGITDILTSDEEINSIHVFFHPEKEQNFLHHFTRFMPQENYQAFPLTRENLTDVFPFIVNLPPDISIFHASNEYLLNPGILREKLIRFFETKDNTHLHWNTLISANTIQTEADAHWIIAAGNGCADLLQHTQLADRDFMARIKAEIIYYNLDSPLDLKGKVFHFSASDHLPGFHLRNDENHPERMKVTIDRYTSKNTCLDETAKIILNVLNLPAQTYEYYDTIERPITLDGRPLVETRLGNQQNRHLVYGHSLFSCGAELFSNFAIQIANTVNANMQQMIFLVPEITADLQPFSCHERFPVRANTAGNTNQFWQGQKQNEKKSDSHSIKARY